MEADIFKVLISLDMGEAMGLDGIGPKVLKFFAVALCEPLRHLFQRSLAKHRIAAEWQMHRIIPIHKASGRASVKNYRPISLLSSTSKVLEHIITNVLRSWKLLFLLFGFLSVCSTMQW